MPPIPLQEARGLRAAPRGRLAAARGRLAARGPGPGGRAADRARTGRRPDGRERRRGRLTRRGLRTPPDLPTLRGRLIPLGAFSLQGVPVRRKPAASRELDIRRGRPTLPVRLARPRRPILPGLPILRGLVTRRRPLSRRVLATRPDLAPRARAGCPTPRTAVGRRGPATTRRLAVARNLAIRRVLAVPCRRARPGVPVRPPRLASRAIRVRTARARRTRPDGRQAGPPRQVRPGQAHLARRGGPGRADKAAGDRGHGPRIRPGPDPPRRPGPDPPRRPGPDPLRRPDIPAARRPGPPVPPPRTDTPTSSGRRTTPFLRPARPDRGGRRAPHRPLAKTRPTSTSTGTAADIGLARPGPTRATPRTGTADARRRTSPRSSRKPAVPSSRWCRPPGRRQIRRPTRCSPIPRSLPTRRLRTPP